MKVPDFSEAHSLFERHRQQCSHHGGPMWAEIARVGKSAFSQSQAEEIFVKARSLAESKWPRPLTATEVVEWGPVIARQFRFMCNHVTAGRAEKTQWARYFRRARILDRSPSAGSSGRSCSESGSSGPSSGSSGSSATERGSGGPFIRSGFSGSHTSCGSGQEFSRRLHFRLRSRDAICLADVEPAGFHKRVRTDFGRPGGS
jgi:hypothetical protein